MVINCNTCGKQVEKKAANVKKSNGIGYCNRSCFILKQRERFTRVEKVCKQCGETFKAYPSDETYNRAKFCGKECKDIFQRGANSPVYVEKPKFQCKQCGTTFRVERWRVKDPTRGQFCSRVCTFRYTVGENNPAWRGGSTSKNLKLRGSLNAELWKLAVLERDHYTCVECGSQDKLEVDHIKSWKYYPELRYAIDNGRVLCKPCHVLTPNFGAGRRNSKGQFASAA